jgi:L-malate glycosyltransferase
MKILVISHTYIAPINREKWKVFAKEYNDSIVKVLIPKFWPATLFNIDAGNCSKDNLNNCEFISLKTRKTGNEVLYSYRFLDLFKILKKFKPDIIHVEQGDNALSYFQIIFIAKLLRLKSKFTFFTWVNWKHDWSLKYKLIWQFIEKFNLKNSAGAFVGNDDAKVILQEKNFLKPIKTLLQLGVNTKYFYPKEVEILKRVARDKVNKKNKPSASCICHPGLVASAEAMKCVGRNSGSSHYKIGFMGRLIKEKGIFDLLQVFSNLKNQFKNWELIFVGEGNEKQSLVNKIKELNLTGTVQILEPVDHKKVGNLLNEFDIFVLPSYDTPEWREQFGHVLIEAMACKIPIIGSTGGEIPNVIGGAGLIFEQKNKRDLKEKLSLLMKNEKLRKELALKGYKRFKNNFSYEIIAKETYKFWYKILHLSS